MGMLRGMSISGGRGYTSYTCGLNKSVITVAAKYQLTAYYIPSACKSGRLIFSGIVNNC